MFFESKDGETLYRQQKQDLELTVAQIMTPLLQNSGLKLKKVGKTTRPFRNDLNKTPYDYSVEVMNRFKGLDLVHRMPKDLWMEVHNIVQEAVPKTITLKNKGKNVKWLFEKALQVTEEKREVKSEGKRERYTN